MDITDVRVKLASRKGDRLKAYCTIVFDGEFVVRDVRIVDGTNGLFVAMPSRKLTVPCEKCGFKNPLLARFCNDCGCKLRRQEPVDDAESRLRLHRDIAHPITGECRELLQQRVVEAYEAELGRVEEEVGEEVDDYFIEEEEEVEVEEEETVEMSGDEEVEVEAELETDEDETEEKDDDPSEYGDLIASLRRHPGQQDRSPTPQRTQRKERPPASDRPTAGDRSREGDRPRESKPARGEGRSQPDADRRSKPPVSEPRKRAEPPAAAKPPTRKTPEPGVPAFGATLGEDETSQRKPASKPAPSPDPAKASEPPKKREDESSKGMHDQGDTGSSFGAGLL